MAFAWAAVAVPCCQSLFSCAVVQKDKDIIELLLVGIFASSLFVGALCCVTLRFSRGCCAGLPFGGFGGGGVISELLQVVAGVGALMPDILAKG